MPNTSPAIPSDEPAFANLLPGLAMPIFVFAAVLVSLLSLSLSIVLPALAQVEVNGELRDVHSLRLTQERMNAELLHREQERDRGLLSVTDPAYDALKLCRGDLLPLAALREQLRNLAASLVSEQDTIAIGQYIFTPGVEDTLTLTGDVRNVGPRSMTVLAQFTEELRRLPSVTAVKPPLFQRVEESDGSMHSPFRIVLTLR